MKRNTWKLFYSVLRKNYRDHYDEMRMAWLNTILYWTSEWIVTHFRTSPSAHIATQSLLTQVLRWFTERITEWYTSVVFAKPTYDVTKIQTSLSELWQIKSYDNFDSNATSSSILYGKPKRNEELMHTDGSPVNSTYRFTKLISECSMRNNVTGHSKF